MSASLNISSVPLSSLQPCPRFGSVRCFLPSLGELGDVDAVEVVGAEGAVALGAFPLSGVVTHLETFVAEHVETLGEHSLLVPGVAARAAQLGLQTHKCTGETMTGRILLFYVVYGATNWGFKKQLFGLFHGRLNS